MSRVDIEATYLLFELDGLFCLRLKLRVLPEPDTHFENGSTGRKLFSNESVLLVPADLGAMWSQQMAPNRDQVRRA